MVEKEVDAMNRQENQFTATQNEEGFHIIFDDSLKSPMELSFEDFQEFANKYAQDMLNGKDIKLDNKEEVMFSLWQMILIPNDNIH